MSMPAAWCSEETSLLEDNPFVTVAKGLPGCQLRRIRLEELLNQGLEEELPIQVNRWISQCAASLVADITLRPVPDLTIGPGEQVEAEAGSQLAGRTNEVTWVAADGPAEFLGTERPGSDGTGLIPLTSETWLTVYDRIKLTGFSSYTLYTQGQLPGALRGFSTTCS